jgi:hypothetical protein
MRGTIILTIVMGLLLTGCALVQPSYGSSGQVPKGYRIPIAQGRHAQSWTTPDITMDYRYTLNQNTLNIDGKMRFAYRIKGNFVWIPHFYMSLISVGSQGRVLSVSPLYMTFPDSKADDVHSFSKVLTLPAGTKYIAFEYRGDARMTGREADSMPFWEYPID